MLAIPPLRAVPVRVLDLQRAVGNAALAVMLQRAGDRSGRAPSDPGPTVESFTAANPGIVAALSREQLLIWHQVIAGWAANRSVDQALLRHEKKERSTWLDPTSRSPIVASDYLREHERIESRRKFVDEGASRATLDPRAILSADITAPQAWNVAAEHRYRTWAVEHFASKPLIAELTTRREIVSALEQAQTPGLSAGVPHVNLLWGGGRIRHSKGIVTWDDLQSIPEFRDAYRATVTESPEVQALRSGISEIDSHITTMKIEHRARSDANRGEDESSWAKKKVRGAVRHVSEGLGAPSPIELNLARIRAQAKPNDTKAQADLAEMEGRTQNYPKLYDDKNGPGIWHEPDLQLSAARRFFKEGKFELAVAALTECEHTTTIATAKFAGYERRVMRGASTAVKWLERAKTAGKLASAFTGTGGVVRAAFGAAGYTFAQEGSQQVVANWLDPTNKIDLAGLVQQSAIDGLATLFGGVTQGAFVKALENRFLARLIKSGVSEPAARTTLGVAGATTAAFYNVPAKIALDKIIAGEAAPTSLAEVSDMITAEVALAPVMELAGRYVTAKSTPEKPPATRTGDREIAPPKELVEALSRPAAVGDGPAIGPTQPGAGTGRPAPAVGGSTAKARADSPEVRTIGPTADGTKVIRETEMGDIVVCQRCARINDEYKPELNRDKTLRVRESAVKQMPPGPNHDAATIRLEASLSTARREHLETLPTDKLKQQIGDPAKTQHPEALAELTRRYEQLPVRRLVEMQRRNSKVDTPIATDVLARRRGEPGTVAEYLQVRNLAALRQMSQYDKAALQALVERYRRLTPTVLERMATKGDTVAAYVIGEPRQRPAMDAATEERLVELIWERRRAAIESAEAAGRAGHRTGDVKAVRAAAAARRSARTEGTVGAMETTIRGIDRHQVRGSPDAPQAQDPAPSADRRYQPPTSRTNEPLPHSAQHHAEDRLLNWLREQIVSRRLPAEALTGKTVRIVVDQAVCQTCAAGTGGGDAGPGVLLQFSRDYPQLRIEVADLRAGSFSVYEGGHRPVHDPGDFTDDRGQ